MQNKMLQTISQISAKDRAHKAVMETGRQQPE
jgi:hypothetical protein